MKNNSTQVNIYWQDVLPLQRDEKFTLVFLLADHVSWNNNTGLLSWFAKTSKRFQASGQVGVHIGLVKASALGSNMPVTYGKVR